MKCALVNTGANVISMCIVPVNLTHSHSGKTVKTHALLDSCSQGKFILREATTRSRDGWKKNIPHYKDS